MKKIIILSLSFMLFISGSYATMLSVGNKTSFSVMASAVANHNSTSILQQKKEDSKKQSKKSDSKKHSKKHGSKKHSKKHGEKKHSKKNDKK